MLVPSHTLVHARVGQGQPADRQRPVGDLYALLRTQRQSANFNTPFSVVLICIEKKEKKRKTGGQQESELWPGSDRLGNKSRFSSLMEGKAGVDGGRLAENDPNQSACL